MAALVRPVIHSMVAALIVGSAGVHPVATAAEVNDRSTRQAVQLAAVPSPFEVYPRVLRESSRNAERLLAQYFEDPFPILRVTAGNQGAALADAAEALMAGDLVAAVVAAIDVIAQPFKTVGAAITYVGDVIRESPAMFAAAIVFAAAPLFNGVAATGKALWDIAEAAFELDVVGVVNAVLNVPATIIDGVLNGGYIRTGILGYLPGLLSVTNEVDMGPGLPSFLITLDQDIAKSIPVRSSTYSALAKEDSVISSTQVPTTDEAVIASPPTVEGTDELSEQPGNAESLSVTDADPLELDQESSWVLDSEEDASHSDSSGVDDWVESDLETPVGVGEAEVDIESISRDEPETASEPQTASETASVDRGTGEVRSSSETDRGARSGETRGAAAP